MWRRRLLVVLDVVFWGARLLSLVMQAYLGFWGEIPRPF